MSESTSLYDRIGGETTIRALVDAFYERILNDPELAPFFRQVPVGRLRRMQHEFFSAALGGPIAYSGQSIARVHFGRGIERRHFAGFVAHLLATLRERGVGEAEADEIISLLDRYAPDVLGEGLNVG
ncbi:MAG: group I truncated hemoglobin [Limisphaerales bacterium]